jgi:hypothetical protein
MKGCQIFFGSKIGKHLQLFGPAHYHATRKNLDNRTQLDEPIECTSGGDPLFHYKNLHFLFFTLVWILCALRFESQQKIINMVLIWNFCSYIKLFLTTALGNGLPYFDYFILIRVQHSII